MHGKVRRSIEVCASKLPGRPTEALRKQGNHRAKSKLARAQINKESFYGGSCRIEIAYRTESSNDAAFGVVNSTLHVTELINCDPENPDAVCEITTGTIEFRLMKTGKDAVALVAVEQP